MQAKSENRFPHFVFQAVAQCEKMLKLLSAHGFVRARVFRELCNSFPKFDRFTADKTPVFLVKAESILSPCCEGGFDETLQVCWR